MKNLTFCFSFLFAILFASCNKNSGPTIVNVVVKDVTTNGVIADSEVGLFETDGESSFGLGGTLLEEKYSDATGSFTFNFTAHEGFSVLFAGYKRPIL